MLHVCYLKYAQSIVFIFYLTYLEPEYEIELGYSYFPISSFIIFSNAFPLRFMAIIL